MKITILGSAAAECWPALFCECDACQTARKTLGKDLRKRTSYLVDDKLLIDFGPDIYWQVTQYDIDLRKIDGIFFTHSHEDHCNPVELLWRRKGFSVVTRSVELYANQTAMDKIYKSVFRRDTPEGDMATIQINPHVLSPGQTVQCGDYKVTAILAQHAAAPELPLNFIIQGPDGKTALIGNDSGWWCEESWNTLKNFKLDIAVIEGTMGPKYAEHTVNHLGHKATVKVRDELKQLGCLADNALVAVNHFSHNGGGLHADYEAFFHPQGILVGYDGLVLER